MNKLLLIEMPLNEARQFMVKQIGEKRTVTWWKELRSRMYSLGYNTNLDLDPPWGPWSQHLMLWHYDSKAKVLRVAGPFFTPPPTVFDIKYNTWVVPQNLSGSNVSGVAIDLTTPEFFPVPYYTIDGGFGSQVDWNWRDMGSIET